MKRRLIALLKLAIPAAILVWLIVQVQRHDPHSLADLIARPKRWGLLGGAFGLILCAVLLTFLRWYLLVRTLGMRFPLADALRLGFLGYLLHFVSAGSVGGDLFKAIFIARGQPGRRAEAVATVVADRILGLYALLLVTSLGLLIAAAPAEPVEMQVLRRSTLTATVVGAVAALVVLSPGFTTGSTAEMLVRLPRVGPALGQVIAAIRLYRSRPVLLLGLSAMSVLVHLLFAVSIYLIGAGLFPTGPTFVEHLVIVPLSMVCGALPLAPAGLGAFEFAMEYLFKYAGTGAVQGQGLVIALAYRVGTIAVAAIGVGYYWASRREVQQLLHEAEEEAEHPTALAAQPLPLPAGQRPGTPPQTSHDAP